MAFLSTTWLLALIPWTAFAAWMLVGRRRRVRVPFLQLWDAPEELRRPKKGFEPPPLALVFALLASLLALLATARPTLTTAGVRGERTLTLLLDRGASMSALGPDRRPRFVGAATALAKSLADRPEPIRLNVIDVPSSGGWQGDARDLPAALPRFQRTALNTADALRAAVQSRPNAGDPLLMVSDQDLGPLPHGVITVQPSAGVRNAGIVALAARPGQAMVTLTANHATTRRLTLRSGDVAAHQNVDLPAAGERNIFIDFQPPSDTIEASLEGADDFDADDHAWLVRSRSWPDPEPRAPLSDELRRMIDVYRRLRPPGEGSVRIAIGRPGDVRADEPAILLAPVSGQEAPVGEVQSQPHPIVTGVDWSSVTQAAGTTSDGPPDGWTAIARAGGKPLVAVHDAQVRQVWVGFASQAFARTPAFVVFWTNVLDWLGAAAAGEAFTASPPAQPTPDARRLLPPTLPPDVDPAYWPGVFETPTGKRALNADRVTFGVGAGTWPARIAALPPSDTGLHLASWLALAAIATLVLAAARWERRRAPTPRPAQHLDAETIQHVESIFQADGHVHRHESHRPPSP